MDEEEEKEKEGRMKVCSYSSYVGSRHVLKTFQQELIVVDSSRHVDGWCPMRPIS